MRRYFFLRAVLFILISLILSVALVLAAPSIPRVFLPVANHGWPVQWPHTDSPLISEVFFDPEGAEPGGEWIELYNSSKEVFDLSSYKVGDAWMRGDAEGMVAFPPGAFLEPGQVILIANQASIFSDRYGFLPDYELLDTDNRVPDMLKYLTWATHSIELTNAGDEVILLDDLDRPADAVSWGSSKQAFDPPAQGVAESHSLERKPADWDRDLAIDWSDEPVPNPGQVDLTPPTATPTNKPAATRTPTPVPSGTPLPCDQASLLVSEVLYDPEGVEPGREWIEVFNPGESWIDLACLRIGDEETPGEQEGMYAFPDGSVLAPGEVAVIANRGSEFLSVYGFAPGYEFQASLENSFDMVKDAGWASGNVDLANSGDEVLVLDHEAALVDAVSWGDSDFEGPPVEAVAEGHSLERYPAWQDTNSPLDWRDQPVPNPGTVDLAGETPTPTPTGSLTATPTLEITSTPTPTETPTPTATQPVPILVINEILGDPHPTDGDSNGDGDVDSDEDDFLEVLNISGAPLDLSGWSVHDAMQHRHLFPEGSIVPDGCAVLVFGGGTPVGDFGHSLVQTASSGGLYLNHFGDTVTIFDSHSNAIATYTYGAEGGYDQSLTRDPDITGEEPLVWHTTAEGSNGALFSPGTAVDGSCFWGCGCEK